MGILAIMGTILLIWIIAAIVIFGLIGWIRSQPTPEQEQKWRREEARIRLIEARTAQLPEQTRGITERYRNTQESRITIMERQAKLEHEIEKLQLQNELLKRELGRNTRFDPDNPPEL